MFLVATSSSWSAASIYEVWADNLEAAFDELEKSLDGYSYIAVDTEFPGVLVRPILSYRDTYQYRYYTTKANVDMLKIIQVASWLCFSELKKRMFFLEKCDQKKNLLFSLEISPVLFSHMVYILYVYSCDICVNDIWFIFFMCIHVISE